jgi:hypothetical protein
MKKFTLTIVAAIGVWLCLSANSNAGVRFSIFLNGPDYCAPRYPVYHDNCGPGYSYGYYRPHYYPHYYHRAYYRPSYGYVYRGR